ncbi:MAG: MFS transporter, partial [Erysipelotrichaceae bacterium]|nr:MFS transporter [Erysipelotrichaceae bacterium]
VCMLTSFASTCYEQCFNYFIKDQYGFPPSYNGYLKGGVGIITMIANATICTYLLNRTDIRKSIIYTLAVCLMMMTGIIVIDEVVPFIVLNVVFFGFNAVYKPLLQSMLNGFSKKSGGSIVGIYNSMSSVGTIVGSLVSGFVYEVSPRGSFVYAAIAFALAIISGIVQRKSDTRDYV